MKPASFIFASALLMSALAARADVLDAASRAFLINEEIEASHNPRLAAQRATVTSYTPMIVKLANEQGLADLQGYSAQILGRRGDLVLACVPASKVSKLNANSNLLTASVAQPSQMTMDVARATTGADNVISGKGLDRAYTGRGVVVGFCDIGFDPNHIAFRDENGNSRVAQFSVINEVKASITRLTSQAEIEAFSTDDASNYHATHVAGIMAGGFRGNDYYGVAPEATIVATTSKLYNVGILAGVEEIINYAKSVGQPAVVNISLGNFLGPHDGTSLFNQYLALQGQDAIICVSSGNNGATCSTLHKTFSASDNDIRSSIYTSNTFAPSGNFDIWSSDSRPLEIRFGVWDNVNKEFCDTLSSFVGTGNSASWEMATSGYFSTSYSKRVYLKAFNDFFKGYVGIQAETNSENDRYHIRLSFNYTTTDANSAGSGARYRIAFWVRGQEGQRADIFTDGNSAMAAIASEGFVYGDSSMSVNDFACGENVICVGMMNSRDSFPVVGMDDQATGFEAGTVSRYSGYGTLLDGRVLPHVIAPGYLISAMSGPYCEANPNAVVASAVETDEFGDTHRWMILSGTSMATPFVVGSIATWLEADPSLNVNDALAYLQSNATNPTAPSKVVALDGKRRAASQTDPRIGASGEINVYNGMVAVLEDNGAELPADDNTDLADASAPSGPVTALDSTDAFSMDSVTLTPGGLVRVAAGHCSNVAATVFSVDGKALRSACGNGNDLLLDCNSLPGGVYIVDVVRDGQRSTRKIALR